MIYVDDGHCWNRDGSSSYGPMGHFNTDVSLLILELREYPLMKKALSQYDRRNPKQICTIWMKCGVLKCTVVCRSIQDVISPQITFMC